MPLISAIGRRSPGVRLLVGCIYFLLIAGGVTMVYPLLLMVGGSLKGGFDAQDIEIVPRYLRDDLALFRRDLESRYNQSLAMLNATWGADHLEWREIPRPAEVPPRRLEDWDEFRRAVPLPPQWFALGHIGPAGRNQRAYKREVLRESGGDLDRAGRLLDTKFRGWTEVVPKPRPLSRAMASTDGASRFMDEFKQGCPAGDRVLADPEAKWRASMREKYGPTLEDYRRKTGRALASWDDLRLASTAPNPRDAVARADWEEYVRASAPFAFLRVSPSADPLYRAFLRRAHGGNLAALNREYGTSFRSFDELSVEGFAGFTGVRYLDFNRFLRTEVPLEMLALDGPVFRYRAFLRERYGNDLAALRAAQGVAWRSFDEAIPPVAAADWRDGMRDRAGLRWELALRNYGYVLDFLARHGRGFQNTFILCILYLVTHLTVNPLAAYALSRFKLPATYKVLLFCMATVAFPGEVMMIPSFLQLKEFGLLNTFAALVLPGMASGYSIFLLKGFFDSLPRELYESAAIDGAREWTVFWNITMSLSKPILAVMALGAFTHAYGAFFFALIICPDERMWTLMVWLYQLQMTSGSQSINYAALCLASIPTLLVFLFCQRIILRGIVVPSEK
jgi:multiple sugar transport system permease protein